MRRTREREARVASRYSRTFRWSKRAIEAAEIQDIGERPRNRRKAIMESVEHRGAQEVMRGIVEHGTVTAQTARGAVEDRWSIHAGLVTCRTLTDKGPVSRLLLPLRHLAALALPPRCPGCGALVGEDHRFCATCWSSLRFIAPPWCAGCNVPFAYDRGKDARCATCLGRAPRHAGIRAAVAYGPVAATLALRLKYGKRTAFARTMARQMARLVPTGAELLIPVPLHRWRLWSRGFNQAALMADALSRRCGVPTDRLTLVRQRETGGSRGLGRRQRAKLVKGAFSVDPARRDRLKGRAVVLVDDVYTTGATADACTRALLGAGAASVTVLCWARVLPDD